MDLKRRLERLERTMMPPKPSRQDHGGYMWGNGFVFGCRLGLVGLIRQTVPRAGQYRGNIGLSMGCLRSSRSSESA